MGRWIECVTPYMQKWLQTIGLSLGGGASGFAGTWLIVHLFGAATLADYLINIAKVSVILVSLELLPSTYSLFQQQRDEYFSKAYPAFYTLMAFVLTIVALIFALVGFFGQLNLFLVAYVGLAVLQRYLDCQLQALGHLAAYYRISVLTNVLRFLFLGAGAIVLKIDQTNSGPAIDQLLWGSLALALLLSLLFTAREHPAPFARLFSAVRTASFALLWRERREYRAYYINSLLKRAKDTMLPLLLDRLLADRALIGVILVHTKSFEAVAAQLRIIEAVFTNLARRARLFANSSRIAWGAAAIAQPACVLVAAILLIPEGLSIEELLPAALLSFGVYPYVFETLSRSSALASSRPRAVTLSLISYTAVLGIGIISLTALSALTPLPIVIVLLAALFSASFSYRVGALP